MQSWPVEHYFVWTEFFLHHNSLQDPLALPKGPPLIPVQLPYSRSEFPLPNPCPLMKGPAPCISPFTSFYARLLYQTRRSQMQNSIWANLLIYKKNNVRLSGPPCAPFVSTGMKMLSFIMTHHSAQTFPKQRKGSMTDIRLKQNWTQINSQMYSSREKTITLLYYIFYFLQENELKERMKLFSTSEKSLWTSSF